MKLSAPPERLEDRLLLTGMPPIAMGDSYNVPWDSLNTSASGQASVLQNDMDMEMDPMTAVLVANVTHGTLSLNSNGHFTYTPTAGYSGSDSFTYKASDGTGFSSTVTVSLSVTTAFGAPSNLEDRPAAAPNDYGPFAISMLTGGVQTAISVAPGHALVYDSMTDPRPVVAADVVQSAAYSAVTTGTAQLTVGSVTGSTLYYTLGAGFDLRFAHQVNASSLATGRYASTFSIAAVSDGNASTRVVNGHVDLINRNASEFGDNWSLAELDRLTIGANGVLLVTGTNVASWFVDNHDGTFTSPAGPMAFCTLVQNLDDS